MCEPDGTREFQVSGFQQGFCREASFRPSKGFHDVMGMLDTVTGMRAKGEVCVQLESQDFRSFVHWLVSEGEKCHSPTHPICHHIYWNMLSYLLDYVTIFIGMCYHINWNMLSYL